MIVQRQDVESAVIAAPPATLPLVVDLDGTLIRTDSTFENFLLALRENPGVAIGAILRAPFDRAAMKTMLAAAAPLNVALLPINDAVLDYVRAERARGRSTHLVTGAHDSIAQGVAAALGVFDSARGTTTRNLKGGGKATYLAERFPDGFAYLGDSPADYRVWAAARSGGLVGGVGGAAAALRRSGAPVEARFEIERAPLAAWARQLRVHQWAKNMLIFAALLLGHAYRDPGVVASVALGFVALSLAASATYIGNDLLDLDSDRRHPRKRSRGFASGRIGIPAGLLTMGALAGTAGAIAAWLGPAFFGALTLYVTVTVAYSIWLKRTPLLDTMVLAWQYTVRIIMGGVLAHVAVSQWLLVFAMFFFLSLSLAKRHVEVQSLGVREVERVAGRGYEAGDAALTLALGVAVGVCSILVLVLYLADGAFPTQVYRSPAWLWGFPVFVALFVMRVWLLAHRGQLHDDPVAFAVKDRYSLMLGSGLAVAFLLATFSPLPG